MPPTFIDRLRDPEFTPLYLAPQAGVSESPFRRLCRQYGADVVVSEFVSAAGIIQNSRRSHKYLRFDEAERPIGVQIFGADPGMMADAARYVEEAYGPDFVDINFGCPVKKVVRRNGGSGCLRDLGLVESIVRAVSDAISVPTTAKIRSGFDQATRDPVRIGQVCQDAGAQVLCLHPRTRSEMYSGRADWTEIEAVKRALEIPVIGNGDIRTGDDARRMRDETGCDGVMIARGSHGDPWIFRSARAALNGDPPPPEPTVEERFEICLAHARNSAVYESDETKAVLEFRKHLGWYTKGIPDGRRFRAELFTVTTIQEIEERLQAYLEEHRSQLAPA